MTKEKGYPDSNEGSGKPPKVLLRELLLRHFASDLCEKVLVIVVQTRIFDGLDATHRDISRAISLAMAKLEDLIRELSPREVHHLLVLREVQIIRAIFWQVAHVQARVAFNANIDHTNTEDFFDTKSDLALEEESNWLIRL